MSPENDDPNSKAISEIIDWAEKRPVWQQEAVVRLLMNGALGQSDFEDLLALALEEPSAHGAITDGPTVPLSTFKSESPSGEAVLLRKIHRLKNVNAVSESSELVFSETGLNIVYGENATGKSGYARILRNACLCRSPSEEILGNVFGPFTEKPASAVPEVTVGGTPRSVLWSDGQPTDPVLSRVFVFDSAAALAHVTGANEIAFRPIALEVLKKLAEACLELKKELESRREKLAKGSRIGVLKSAFRTGSTVQRSVAAITKESKRRTFEDLSKLDDREIARKKQLSADLAADPVEKIRELELRRQKLDRVLTRVELALDTVGPESQEELIQLVKERDSRKEAAELAAKQAFGSEPLDGVGSEVWNALWEAARSFSGAKAYPERPFPVVDKQSRCVLCLQELDDAAKDRLVGFETYVQKETQQRFKDAERSLRQGMEGVRRASFPPSRDLLSEADLGDEWPTVRRFYVLARARQRGLSRIDTDWEPSSVPTLPPSPAENIRGLISSIERRKGVLQAEKDSPVRQALREELADLEDRTRLTSHLSTVGDEIAIAAQLSALDLAIKTTDTSSITRKATALSESLVSPLLLGAFESEVQRLGMYSSQVELASVGGKYGRQRYRVRLVAEQAGMPEAILSEGEKRCVALAGFLAELSTASHRSSVVLDDPVCSLDHRWRRFAGDRLVKEAGNRQVIIFTHDAVFLLGLMEHADAVGVPLHLTYLHRRGKEAGVPENGVPWIAMKVTDRIKFLNAKLQTAEAVRNKLGETAYEPLARELYGFLREAWERAVEEILLNQVVLRFGREVRTLRLKPLTDIEQRDVEDVDAAMTKCSKYFRGHDEAPAIVDPVPGPSGIRSDIKKLDDWAKGMRKRGR